MSDLHTEAVFRELITSGLIAAQPAPRALAAGNIDRKDRAARSSWCVALPAGGLAKLTLGHELGCLAARHAAFAQACPEIATAQLFFAPLTEGEALAEEFFEGSNLEAATQDPLFPPTATSRAVSRVCQGLAATEQASTEAARREEWQTWSNRLVALPAWQGEERVLLGQTLLPALYAHLATHPPVTRWTNGDFLPANILLNATGESRLIDTEFAIRTHFFAEDAVRFRSLSPLGPVHRKACEGLLPETDLCWDLYFWLRQLGLEYENNTAEYVSRVWPQRLALIRRLAETTLDLSMVGWSVPPLAVEYRLELAHRLPGVGTKARLCGWSFVPTAGCIREFVALQNGKPAAGMIPLERLDVAKHFQDEPRASNCGYDLLLNPCRFEEPVFLCAVIDPGTLVPVCRLNPKEMPFGAFDWNGYGEWTRRHESAPPPVSGPGMDDPLFSIVLPVHNTPAAYLQACLASVLAQHDHRWELCVVDDGSTRPGLADALKHSAASDSRIRVHSRESNGGIARATNDAVSMARGEYLVFLDHDDVLHPGALAAFRAELRREPSLDAIYSDEDKIAEDGAPVLPFLKPDFSPEFLLGVMYVGHALCVRTTLARDVGGFDPAFDGVQDYEFLLRLTRRTRRIGHIPKILYHWRQSPTSSALQGNIKGNMDRKQVEAVAAHLRALGDTRQARMLGNHRVRLVSTTGPATDIVRLPSTASPLPDLCRAARTSAAQVLVLLPEGCGRPSDQCLRDLASLASQEDCGCAAPVLIAREGLVLEAGRAAVPDGLLPLMSGFEPAADGYNGSLACNREVDAVAPFGAAIRRDLLLDAAAGSSGDWNGFCDGLRQRGLFLRVCASAGLKVDASWLEAPALIPGRSVAGGKYNPGFNRDRGDYSLAALNSDLPAASLSGPSVRWHIDQPTSWQSLPRSLIIRGWCFEAKGNPVQGVRLRTDSLVLTGVTALSRPDVKTAVVNAPDNNTGFEIRGTLPGGNVNFAIEAQLAGGSWVGLISGVTRVKHRFVPLWLGGGDWMDLMFFQMPAHMAHPPRAITPERFPGQGSGFSRPRLSIVTPSYNHGRFLPQTIARVIDQENVNCEYVVQDGRSTDGTREIIETYSSRLHAWAIERDRGQADAIAKGFAKTSGGPDDVMAWINSDDFYLPGALAFVAGYFARHPEVDVIYGHRIVVNEESREIARWFLPRHDPEVLRLNDFVPQETMFWRRRIWDQVGGIDPSFNFAMDWDLLLRFQSAGARIVRVPYFLACFRVHAAQKTSSRMQDVGQKEIDLLRERAQGRPFPREELEQNPRLLRYLRRSALIEFMWKLGLRMP